MTNGMKLFAVVKTFFVILFSDEVELWMNLWKLKVVEYRKENIIELHS